MATNPTPSTTIAELRAPTVRRDPHLPPVRAGFSDLEGFELAQRAAKALSSSSLVPQNYQGNLADCIVALELAQRIGASPLMVMQNLYIVHGKPAWSSQFLIAAVNQCGRYTALQYEWTGTPNTDAWTCRAWAKDKSTGERVQGPAVSIAMAKKEGWATKNGSKWQTIPELMLMYRAATFFARTNAPELTMGLQSHEEAHDIIDTEQTAPGQFTATVETLKQPEPTNPTPAVEPAEIPKPRGRKRDEAKEVEPAAAANEAGAPEPYTDEVHALLAVDCAKDEGEASAVVDLCKGQPFYAKVVEGFNRKYAQVVGGQ
jgi:hypothetical protein